jgi:hypothetical protein
MSQPTQRVTMECPIMIGVEPKILLDGLRVPATKADVRRLVEATWEDMEHGYTPPKAALELVSSVSGVNLVGYVGPDQVVKR